MFLCARSSNDLSHTQVMQERIETGRVARIQQQVRRVPLSCGEKVQQRRRKIFITYQAKLDPKYYLITCKTSYPFLSVILQCYVTSLTGP